MNFRRYADQNASDAMAALISGGLLNPHLPEAPTVERARKVLPWLERETDHPITWETDTSRTDGIATFAGRIQQADPGKRRAAIEAWASVIGSWSITDDDGVLEAIGVYQGFSVDLVATP